MDFLRRSFLPGDGTGEMLPDRCRSADDALPLFPFRFPTARRFTMTTRGKTEPEVSDCAPLDSIQLHGAQLHAELRDLPLPAGFMLRIRQFVDFGPKETDFFNAPSQFRPQWP